MNDWLKVGEKVGRAVTFPGGYRLPNGKFVVGYNSDHMLNPTTAYTEAVRIFERDREHADPFRLGPSGVHDIYRRHVPKALDDMGIKYELIEDKRGINWLAVDPQKVDFSDIPMYSAGKELKETSVEDEVDADYIDEYMKAAPKALRRPAPPFGGMAAPALKAMGIPHSRRGGAIAVRMQDVPEGALGEEPEPSAEPMRGRVDPETLRNVQQAEEAAGNARALGGMQVHDDAPLYSAPPGGQPAAYPSPALNWLLGKDRIKPQFIKEAKALYAKTKGQRQLMDILDRNVKAPIGKWDLYELATKHALLDPEQEMDVQRIRNANSRIARSHFPGGKNPLRFLTVYSARPQPGGNPDATPLERELVESYGNLKNTTKEYKAATRRFLDQLPEEDRIDYEDDVIRFDNYTKITGYRIVQGHMYDEAENLDNATHAIFYVREYAMPDKGGKDRIMYTANLQRDARADDMKGPAGKFVYDNWLPIALRSILKRAKQGGFAKYRFATGRMVKEAQGWSYTHKEGLTDEQIARHLEERRMSIDKRIWEAKPGDHMLLGYKNVFVVGNSNPKEFLVAEHDFVEPLPEDDGSFRKADERREREGRDYVQHKGYFIFAGRRAEKGNVYNDRVYSRNSIIAALGLGPNRAHREVLNLYEREIPKQLEALGIPFGRHVEKVRDYEDDTRPYESIEVDLGKVDFDAVPAFMAKTEAEPFASSLFPDSQRLLEGVEREDFTALLREYPENSPERAALQEGFYRKYKGQINLSRQLRATASEIVMREYAPVETPAADGRVRIEFDDGRNRFVVIAERTEGARMVVEDMVDASRMPAEEMAISVGEYARRTGLDRVVFTRELVERIWIPYNDSMRVGRSGNYIIDLDEGESLYASSGMRTPENAGGETYLFSKAEMTKGYLVQQKLPGMTVKEIRAIKGLLKPVEPGRYDRAAVIDAIKEAVSRKGRGLDFDSRGIARLDEWLVENGHKAERDPEQLGMDLRLSA